VEVAKLAGVPDRVVRRAREILEQLEQCGAAGPRREAPADDGQFSLSDLGAAEVAARLRLAAVETMTPIEALNLLYELKQKL
jgi:DNA mismatch repair protein MutS